MRIKISLLSLVVFLFLGAFFFLSTPQQANACSQYCSSTCNTAYYYIGTYCNIGPYYTLNTSCTAGCPTPIPTCPSNSSLQYGCSGSTCYQYCGTYSNSCSSCPTPVPTSTPTPTPTSSPTPTPLVCTAPQVTCSQCAGGICVPYCASGSCLTDCSLCPTTPTPVPTGSTPAPTPGPYSIQGNVFVDANKDQKLDNGESLYTGTVTITSTAGSVSYPSQGKFQVTGLSAGTYTVSYTSGLPGTNWIMTIPTGAPPSFSVTVGPGCAATGSPDATCSSDNVQNLNFGMSDSIPWIQTGGGGDVRTDGGFSSSGTGGSGSSFNNPIPDTANTSCSGGAYTSVNSAGSPGVVYTGNGSANFGQGSASVNNWVSGGASYPESFAPGAIGGVIKSSYAYMQSIAQQANITPVDITSNSSYCNLGGLTNCQLSSSLPHGIYIANGSLTLTGTGSPASYTFPANQNYIILVNGDLTIDTQIHVPVGSTVIFSVKGSIYVDKSVGESNYLSTATDLEGIFSADQNFVINGTNDCATGPDNRLNVAGAIIVNAGLNGGTVQNNRDLCGNDAYCPVFTVQSRPDFILNLPNFVRKTNYTWQEVAP